MKIQMNSTNASAGRQPAAIRKTTLKTKTIRFWQYDKRRMELLITKRSGK